MPTKTNQYKLRSGAPMPVAGGFVTHTFMAEKYEVDNYQVIDSLVGSEQFRGQGGNLYSANFTRIGAAGGQKFQGNVVHSPVIIDESEMGA